MDAKNNIETFSWGKFSVTGDAKSIAAVKDAVGEVDHLRYVNRGREQEIERLTEKLQEAKPVGLPVELRHLLPGAR